MTMKIKKPSKSFKEMFEQARKSPDYHKQYAILEFTEAVIRIMKEKKITFKKLSQKTNVQAYYLKKMMEGHEGYFTLDFMVKIAMALGCRLEIKLEDNNK